MLAYALARLRTGTALIFGRVTYEGMAAHWQTATDAIAVLMNSLPTYVTSTTLPAADWHNTTLIGADAVNEIAALKQRADGNLFVFGSADLSRQLLNAGLFDEICLAVTATIIGDGRPLFGPGANRLDLTLRGTDPLCPACTVLRYDVGA